MRVVPSTVVEVITRTYPWTQMVAEYGRGNEQSLRNDQAINVGMIARLARSIPPELRPVDLKDAHTFSVALAALEAAAEAWAHPGNSGYHPPLGSLPALDGYSPIAALLIVLKKCPDDVVMNGADGLEFITDDAQRLSLLSDVEQSRRALGNREYKAATVMAGSVIEALLLWAIERRGQDAWKAAVQALKALPDAPSFEGPPEKWTLRAYVDVARHLEIIPRTLADQLSPAVKFRNLIHPGLVRRTGQDSTDGTAHTAVAGMLRVIEEFEKQTLARDRALT